MFNKILNLEIKIIFINDTNINFKKLTDREMDFGLLNFFYGGK
jgi:hypothetical protein